MAWYDEAVFYHIYPLGLSGAPKHNEYAEPVHRLRDMKEWIGHIKGIGCNALYIGPLFESVGHGYETTDYKKLDSRLGDNEDLKDFVATCHAQGIRVIFDGVFNHTGRDFFAFADMLDCSGVRFDATLALDAAALFMEPLAFLALSFEFSIFRVRFIATS